MRKRASSRAARIAGFCLSVLTAFFGFAALGAAGLCRDQGLYRAEHSFSESALCRQYVGRCADTLAAWLSASEDGRIPPEDAAVFCGSAVAYRVLDEEENCLQDSRRSEDEYVSVETTMVFLPDREPAGDPERPAEDTVTEELSPAEDPGRFCRLELWVQLPPEKGGGLWAEWTVYGILERLRAVFPAAGALLLCLSAAAALPTILYSVKKRPKSDRLPADLLAGSFLVGAFLLCRAGLAAGGIVTEALAGSDETAVFLRETLFAPPLRLACGWGGVLGAACALLRAFRNREDRPALLLARVPTELLGLVCFAAGTLFGMNGSMLAWGLLTGAGIAFLLIETAQLSVLRDHAAALAAGKLDRKLNAARYWGNGRKLAEELNRLGDGMTAAVEESLRSERFKTELITNVTHDLRTPLTSIVGSAELMARLPELPAEAAESLEVIERQSRKLKKLTEDLLEASKISSGVMPVRPEETDLRELLIQALGEYDERLRLAGIEPVVTLPENGVPFRTDPRLLWRITENLLQNAVKYAQPGTRFYAELSAGEKEARVSFRNVSAKPLNVTAEKLLERFVRGDESRAGEGSGLGLCIARSLTELLGGEFLLTVDGDLFKTELLFPREAPAPAADGGGETAPERE